MASGNDPDKYKHLPLVPETVLRKRHDLDDLRRKRAAAKDEELLVKASTGGGASNKEKWLRVRKPETFIKRAKARYNNEIRYHRVRKKGMQKRASNKKVITEKEITPMDEDDDDSEEDEDVNVNSDQEEGTGTTEKNIEKIKYQSNSVGANMVFVIRVRGKFTAPKLVRAGLSRLRLRNINDGVFVKYDAANRKLLHMIEPFVIYGKPTKGIIKDLIERKGYGKNKSKERIPLSDNLIIEDALGDHGVICIEDLVHELYTGTGEAFGPCAKFLWPFKLSFPSTFFQRKTLSVHDITKDYGDRGDEINEYIKRML